MENLLEIEGLECSYSGSVKVLSGVSFRLGPGRVFGIIGENGAGKSTLVKCILDLVPYQKGVIRKNGRVAAIHQEFNLVKDLSVAENICLGREPKTFSGLLDRKKMRAVAEAEFRKMGVSIDPDASVDALTISERQMTEIAKATSLEARVLILDEPSTLLNCRETENLFRIIRRTCEQGNSVIYISHKLDEVREICDDVAVLRDGVLMGIVPAKETDPGKMAEMMVGRELKQLFPDKLPPPQGDAVLELRHLASGSRVRDVSFAVHAGEILGIAGLAGSGRSETAEAVFGLRKITGGEMLLKGRSVRFRSAREAMEHGIGYLTEDRQESGLLTAFPIRENVTLSSLRNYLCCGLLRSGKCREKAGEYIRKFRIRCTGPEQEVRFLSGGNQQKTAIAKCLDRSPEVFIFDEPTRGVDVGARREIYDFIRELAAGGMACIMICSDLEELLGMCRKVMVMRNGCTAGFAEENDLNEQTLIRLATGV